MSGETTVPNAPRWHKCHVTQSRLESAPVVVEGFTTKSVPGLAVTRHSDMHYWSVTHIASGHAVGPRCYSKKSAQFVLLAFAPLTDWTQGKDAIWADPSLCLRAMELRESLLTSGSHPWIITRPAPEMPAEVHALSVHPPRAGRAQGGGVAEGHGRTE